MAELRLLISNALAPSTSNSASRAVRSNSCANVTISLSPCFIKLSPIFRWAVLHPNLSYICSSIPFQLTWAPLRLPSPMAPELSRLVYNSGFNVILATLLTE